MKYIVATIMVILSLVLTVDNASDFFSMWLFAEPLALLCAKGVSFDVTPSYNYEMDYRSQLRKFRGGM